MPDKSTAKVVKTAGITEIWDILGVAEPLLPWLWNLSKDRERVPGARKPILYRINPSS